MTPLRPAAPPPQFRRTKPVEKSSKHSAETIRDAIVKLLDDDKGEHIVAIDLEGKSNIADYTVIASGRSGRQVAAMADHIVAKIQPLLSFRITIEGATQGDWVLIDCGDVIVHLFRPEVRAFYAIEKMWGLEPPAAPDGSRDHLAL